MVNQPIPRQQKKYMYCGRCEEDKLLMFKIGMEIRDNLAAFWFSMLVIARWAGLSISEKLLTSGLQRTIQIRQGINSSALNNYSQGTANIIALYTIFKPLVTQKEYQSIGTDNVHPFRTTLCLSGIFQQDNSPCHKVQIIWKYFLDYNKDLSAPYWLQWPPHSPDFKPIQKLWDVEEW